MNLKILSRQETDRYEVRRQHVLQYPAVRQLFILGCILADTFTLWTVVDLMLTQQPAMTIVITVTVAAVINIAPMLAASYLKNDEAKRGSKIAVCTALACLFAVLFVSTFSLRIASQEQLYGSSSELNISIQTGGQQTEMIEDEEFKPTTAQNVLAILLGLEPLATSVCTFVVTYEFSEKRKRRHLYELQIIKLKEEVIRYEAMREELKSDMEFDLDEYDKALFEEFKASIRQLGENAKVHARRRLCETVGTPEGVSQLMEADYRKSQTEGDESQGSSPSEDNSRESMNQRTKCVA